MKKAVLVILGVVLVLGLMGYNIFLERQATQSEPSQSQENTHQEEASSMGNEIITSEITSQESTSQESEAIRQTTETIQKSEPETQTADEDIQALLKSFGTNWINYETIYERNQSVRDYLTEICIKENGIDVDPHVGLRGEGKITGIYQSLDNPYQYIVVGEERVEDIVSDIILEVEVDKEQVKISNIVVNYKYRAY